MFGTLDGQDKNVDALDEFIEQYTETTNQFESQGDMKDACWD